MFQKIKSALKGRRFQDTEDLKKKSDEGTGSFSPAGVPQMLPTGGLSV